MRTKPKRKKKGGNQVHAEKREMGSTRKTIEGNRRQNHFRGNKQGSKRPSRQTLDYDSGKKRVPESQPCSLLKEDEDGGGGGARVRPRKNTGSGNHKKETRSMKKDLMIVQISCTPSQQNPGRRYNAARGCVGGRTTKCGR